MAEYLKIVNNVAGLLLGIALMAFVASSVFSAAFGLVGFGTGTDEITPETDQPIELDFNVDEDDEVSVGVAATTGQAVSLDGTGYANASEPDDWDSGDWSVAAVGSPDVDAGAYENQTYALLTPEGANGGELFVGWSAGNWTAIYQNGTQNASASVEGTADQTPTVVTFNESDGELVIHADDQTDTGSLNDERVDEPDPYRWVGSIDEVRYIDGEMTSEQIDTYQADPVDPLADATHLARWMFDEGEGDEVSGYEGAEPATLISASFTSGVAGPDLVEGTDFNVSTNPLSVTVLSGGYLDGAPTAYVTAEGSAGAFVNLLSTLASTGGAALSLLVIGALVLAARAVMDEFGGGI